MEIKDYLRLIRRRLWIVVGVPLLVLIVTAVVLLVQPREYRVTATVVVPATQVIGSLVTAVDQSVSDFEGAIGSDAVIEKVSSVTGVSKQAVAGGLSTERLGTSSVVEVTYETDESDMASAVAGSASKQALALVQKSISGPLEEQRTMAEQSYEAAMTATESFLSETGLVNPPQVFKMQASRLVALRDALGHAIELGQDAEARRLQARIDQKEAELTDQVVTYQRLTDERQRALSALQLADNAYFQAEGGMASAEQGETITVSKPELAPRLGPAVRQLTGAVVVAAALAIGLVVLLEFLYVRPPRREVAGSAGVGDPGVAESVSPDGAPDRPGSRRRRFRSRKRSN